MRLDKALADFKFIDTDSQIIVIDSLRPELSAMFTVITGSQEEILPSTLLTWSKSDVVKVFQPAVDSVYPNLKNLEQTLGQIIEGAQLDSLITERLTFATVTWGNTRPIARVDSIVLIALNHYLGADYPGYNNWDSYRRVNKTPEQLPYDITTTIIATSNIFTVDGREPTLLDRMLYEGAIVEAKLRLVPRANLAEALGYSPAQLEFASNHRDKMWQELAMRRMAYDTDPMTINRMIYPAPSSPLINNQAPGSVGRYIGYTLVADYLKKHPETSLKYLLSPDFYTNPAILR